MGYQMYSIVQGNNQMFGSPVNRIKITGFSASNSLARLPDLSFTQRARENLHHAVFLSAMYSIDLAFWVGRVRRWLTRAGSAEGFEDELERTMKNFAKDNLGVEIQSTVFEG